MPSPKLLLLVAFLAVTGCNQGQMAAGLKGLNAGKITPEQEDELGQTVVLAATNRWPIYDRPALNKYVTLVGLTVASVSAAPDLPWRFAVLDSSDLGAYSGPGGYVMITRGAIAAMEDEAELAAVLAHEIAHVVNRDGVQAVKNARLKEAGLEFAAASDSRLAQFNKFGDAVVDAALKTGWDQPQESKADGSAVKLLIAAGYDPGGLPRFLKRMEGRTGGRAKAFGTHPGTADRIARTTSQIDAAKVGQPGATNRDRFARAAAEARL